MKKKIIVPVVALALGTSSLAGCKQNPAPKPSAPTLSSLRFDTTAMTLEYVYEAEAVSLDGLKVYAVYSDSSETEVSDYTYNAADLTITQEDRAGAKFGTKKKVAITYQTKSKNLEFTIKPEVVDWNEETLALMDSHLLGVHLPFNRALKNKTYESGWDSETQGGLFYIEAEGTYDQDSLTSYKATFLESEGWSTSTQTIGDGKVVSFQKEVARDNDAPAVIQGGFTVADGGGAPAATGNFALTARVVEPYDKDWPAAKVASLVAEEAPDSDVSIPAFTASYFGVSAAVSGQSYGSITGYGIEADPSSTYEASLTGWTLDNKQTYPYALSPDEKFGIYYVYTASSKTFTIVVLEARKKSAEWPATDVAAIVSNFAHGDAAPSFSGEAAQAVSEYGINGNVITLAVTAGQETAVMSAFQTQSGYDVSVYDYWGDGTITLVSPNKNIMIWMWKAKDGQVNIQFEPFKIADALVKQGFTEALPSIIEKTSLEDGFDSEYRCYELKQESSAAVTAKISEFRQALFAAGWLPRVIGTSTYYCSPAQSMLVGLSAYQTFVDVYVYQAGTYALPESKDQDNNPVFPSQAIAEFLGEDHAAVPALAGGAAYLIDATASAYTTYVRFATEEAAAEAETSYKASLAANYDEQGESTGVYKSKDSTTGITVAKVGCYVSIKVEDVAVFPLAAINTFLDEEFTDAQVPVIAKADGIKFAGSGDTATGVYTVTVTYSDAAGAASAKTAYETALLEKGFVEPNEGSGVYGSAALALQVTVSVNEAVLTIAFKSIYKSAINSTAVNTALGTSFTAAQLPAIPVKYNVGTGISQWQSGIYFNYIVSSMDDYSSDWDYVYNAFYANAYWAYEGADSNNYDWFYSRVYPWLEVRIRPANITNIGVCIVVEYFVDEAARGLSEFLGYGYYSTCVPPINNGDFTFHSTEDPSIAYVTFGDYTDDEDMQAEGAKTGEEKAQAAAAAYAAQLGSYYFDEIGTGVYCDGSVIVSFDTINNEGHYSVKILFTVLSKEEQVAYLLCSLLEVSDYTTVVPELPFANGEIDDMNTDYQTYGEVTLQFTDATTAEQKAQAYITALTSTQYGFEYVAPVEPTDVGYYVNSDGVKVYVSVDEKDVTFKIVTVAPTTSEDVESALNQFFGVEDYKTVIPAIPNAEIGMLSADDDLVMVAFLYEELASAETDATTYVSSLVDDFGFTDNENGTYSKTIGGFDYTVSVEANEYEEAGLLTISITFEEHVPTEFEKAIAALNTMCGNDYKTYFPSLECDALAEACTGCSDATGEDGPATSIQFTFESEEEAQSALEAYMTVLADKGFVQSLPGYAIYSKGDYNIYINPVGSTITIVYEIYQG